MKLPISWLRDWVEFEGDAARVAEALTLRGFYVEGVESIGHAYPGVVVARVLDVQRHPQADRLSLCRVDGGAGELRVVCGAPNVVPGMIAPLATVGARLPDGTVIRKSKIRGEESQGMLCSARELELSDDHEGIVDLVRLLGEVAAGALGRPLAEALGPPEQVLEIEIPFNRPDGQGVLGLAREVKAALGGRWTESARVRLAARWSPPVKDAGAFDLELEDADGCPRYIAQAIEGVTVAPSPSWMQRRLVAAGQRPVNNLVDLTNWILLELGQPLHAFDLARLRGPSIRVRRARASERLTTLDGKERALDPEVLVIADAERAVALAGLMGGADTEVTPGTTALLLECAWFSPPRIRRGSRQLGLATEASRRFERGVDRDIGPVAAARYLELLGALSPGFRLGAARERDLAPPAPRTLALRRARTDRVLGVAIESERARALLEALEFAVVAGEPLAVTVPTWRPDVEIEDDLVEEVGRSHGYDRLPEKPLETGGCFAVRTDRERLAERARRAMLARGLHEAWSSTLVSEREALAVCELTGDGEERLVRLANPMSREGEVLRPSLAAGLLRACAHNMRQGARAVRLFEIGTVFRAVAERGALPEERTMLAAIVTGPRLAHDHDAGERESDFLDAKGLWEAWLEEMSVDTPEWRAYSSRGWKPGASAELASAASRIGWAGTLGTQWLRDWDIEVPVHLFTVLLDAVSPARTPARVSLPGRFPPVRRDLAYFVPTSVAHHPLETAMRRAGGEWLRTIELFDVYTGPGTPPGMKSLAFALEFQHPERTLAEAEVETLQRRMTAEIEKQFGGRLRDQ